MTKKIEVIFRTWANVFLAGLPAGFLAGWFLLPFLFVDGACAMGQSYQKSEKRQSSDVKADKALGVLPSKAQTPLEKEAARMEAQSQSEAVLREQNEKQAEEERKRVHRQVAEDKLIGL